MFADHSDLRSKKLPTTERCDHHEISPMLQSGNFLWWLIKYVASVKSQMLTLLSAVSQQEHEILLQGTFFSSGHLCCSVILFKKKEEKKHIFCLLWNRIVVQKFNKKSSSSYFILQLIQVKVHDFNTLCVQEKVQLLDVL